MRKRQDRDPDVFKQWMVGLGGPYKTGLLHNS